MPGDAPPDEHHEHDAGQHAPHPVRVAARGVLAGLATELLLTAALVGLWRALHGEWGPPAIFLFALGAGLAGGLGWGVAETVAGRLRWAWAGVLAGVLAGAPIAALAPLAGDYVLRLRATGSSLEALEGTLDLLDGEAAGPLATILVCALCLHVPLLVVRRRGPDLVLEALAMSLGLVAWVVSAAALRDGALSRVDDPWSAHASIYAVVLLPRAVVLPLLLRAADRACAYVGGRARGADAEPRAPVATSARRRPPTPVERHRARWHDDRAQEHAQAARLTEAAAERARAQALWPTVERALALADAHARALAVEPAIAALEQAAALAGRRPPAFDPTDACWEPLRGHARFEALTVAPSGAAPRALGPTARMGLVAYVVTLTLLAAAPAALWPDEPAEVTRGRVRALLGGGPGAWREVGEALEIGAVGGFAGSEWTPGRFVTLGATKPEPAPERVLEVYLRAGEGGDAEGMLRASDALACYPERRAEAADWCRRAAEAGHPRGMWRWGTMLRGGWFGLMPDDAAGRAWWVRAAEAGHPEAQVDLARWHARRGDLTQADAWYARAAASGHETAEEEREALNEGPAAAGE